MYSIRAIYFFQCNSMFYEMHVFQPDALESKYLVNPLNIGRRLSGSFTASVSLACVIMVTEKDKRNLEEYMKFSKSACNNQ